MLQVLVLPTASFRLFLSTVGISYLELPRKQEKSSVFLGTPYFAATFLLERPLFRTLKALHISHVNFLH